MEPARRLIATCEKLREDITASKTSTIMALHMVNNPTSSTALASPASITALLGDPPPDELFLPPTYGAAAQQRATPPASLSLVAQAEQRKPGANRLEDPSNFMSILKGDKALSLRDALQHDSGVSLVSLQHDSGVS